MMQCHWCQKFPEIPVTKAIHVTTCTTYWLGGVFPKSEDERKPNLGVATALHVQKYVQVYLSSTQYLCPFAMAGHAVYHDGQQH